MTSPAQRHMMRVSAVEAAQRVDNPLRHATAYEQMLVKLAADRTKLKLIHSVEKKAEHKRAMLPSYAHGWRVCWPRVGAHRMTF